MRILFAVMMLCLTSLPLMAADTRTNPTSILISEEKVGYLSLKRFGSFYVSPLSYTFSNEARSELGATAGISYRTGTHAAFKFQYNKPYRFSEHEGQVAWVLHF